MEISTSKSLMVLPEGFKGRSFWEKPEGNVGMVLASLGIAGLAGLVWVLLPILATMTGLLAAIAGNLFVGIPLAVGVALMIYSLTRSKTWLFGKILFKRISRFIAYKIIRADPFGTLRTLRNNIAEMYDKYAEGVDALHGQKILLKKRLDKNAFDQKQAIELAVAAKDRDPSQARVQALKANRLKESNERLAKPYRLMEVLEAALRKYQNICDENVQILDTEITVAQGEYEAAEAAYSASTVARQILSRGTDDFEMLDMTMEYLASNYAEKLGSVEGFLEQSQSIIAGFDLQHAVDDEKAMKAIEEWANKGDQLLLEHLGSSTLLPDLTVDGLFDTDRTPDYVRLLDEHR